MIRNYFILNRFVIEAAAKLVDSTILSIFSQEKDRILFELGNKTETFFLEFSLNPGDPFINIREKYARAKKNTISFFPEFLNKKIKTIQIADDDRIIKIIIENGSVYFTIRGKFTNILAISNIDNIIAFKKTETEDLRKLGVELISKNYNGIFNIPDLLIDANTDYKVEIRNRYPVISKEIILEVQRRSKADSAEEIRNNLYEVLINIRDRKAAVFINEKDNKINLAVDSFGIFEHQKKEVFKNIISAQSYYLSKRYFLKEKESQLKILNSSINKELNKIFVKINKLTAVVDKGTNEEEYRKFGNLLLINLDKIKPGMDEISLDDIYTQEKKITIKINKKVSSKKNAEIYFEKAKAENLNYKKSSQLLKQAQLDFKKLKIIQHRILTSDDLDELKRIMNELKIKQGPAINEKDDLRTKFKRYIIESKFNIYVGKDSKNNDLLTTKFAKQNDYWFHARSVSGSHVVLRIDNTKEPVPKSVLKKAASIAAYHSKSKTSGLAPVAFTLKKYVVKKKGDPVGTVHLLKEDVLLVKPEIPNGCEFISNE